MNHHSIFPCAILTLVLSAATLRADTTRTDVVIYGATPAGIAAAIAADRAGASVVLLEHGTHIGGMMASGLGHTVGAVPQSPSSDGPDFPLLGKIKPRPAKEIVSSSWSIGGETLDRDFGVYANYKKFLGPLGAKAIRVQTGWAKCETKPGIYDFAWLDEVVNDAIAQGVQPWLEVT